MRKGTVPLLVSALALVVLLLPGCGASSDNTSTTTPGTPGSSAVETGDAGEQSGETETITMAEYDQIQEGMSYEQAVEITGGPGKLLKEVTKSDGSTITRIYYWKGNGGAASQAELSFEDGKLVYRLQSGLQ
jgi:hypothetical protein